MTDTQQQGVALAEVDRIEDVLDRQALNLLCRSFHDLFGISIRVFATDGALLADVHQEQDVCRYVNTFTAGRAQCATTVGSVKDVYPADDPVIHPCFSGAVYRVVGIEYQGRRIGRFVIGPYLPAEKTEAPESLLAIDKDIDPEEALHTLADLPRVREETSDRIVAHLSGVLDMVLFSSHRAHLTSEMHIASVRESFRELAEKTAQLQQAYDRLKELDRLKSNFMATVSHELRTPLTSIIGYSEMLASGLGGTLSSEQGEYVGTIRTKGDHLLQLITSLLDMNQLEQGHMALEKQAADVAALVEDVCDTLLPKARKGEVTIKQDLDSGLAPIDGDPVRLKQVFINLVDNAVKFTPKGGTVTIRAKSVELASGPDGGIGLVLMAAPKPGVEIQVADTGIGIPESDLERVFDAFYQVDQSSTRAHGGAGLGLSIVKRLVDAHRGKIRVESEPGEGTTISVTLPAATEDSVS